MASLIYPTNYFNQSSPLRSSTLRAGAELGLYTFLGFSLQAVGLETTTAARSAFLLYLNVKMVPFLAYALYGRSISTSTWTSALLALTGEYRTDKCDCS